MFSIEIKNEILKYGAKIGEMGYWQKRMFMMLACSIMV